MSLSVKLTSKQLKVNIENEQNTDKGAREVQQQVKNAEEVLNPESGSSKPNTVLNTIHNEFEHMCIDDPVRVLKAHPIRQSTDDHVPGRKYSIPGLPGNRFFVHQLRTIWFIMSRWLRDADMPGALVADAMGLGKTFTSVAVAMLRKYVTEQVAMWLPLSFNKVIPMKSG